jgi:hypothetical protein
LNRYKVGETIAIEVGNEKAGYCDIARRRNGLRETALQLDAQCPWRRLRDTPRCEPAVTIEIAQPPKIALATGGRLAWPS